MTPSDSIKAIRLALEACNSATEDWERDVMETRLSALCHSASMRELLDELERLRAALMSARELFANAEYCSRNKWQNLAMEEIAAIDAAMAKGGA